jgi:hypothetical protein
MALPHTIRVKLSSEAADSIALTPVVVQELALRDLVEHMLGITGKDEDRVRELLRRGSLVSGASRFRWAGWEAEAEGVRELLAAFPDPEPERPFVAAQCIHAILRGGRQPVEIAREAGERKSLFQRATFWDAMLAAIAAGVARYDGYSYRKRADRYVHEFDAAELAQLRAASALMRYTTLQEKLRTLPFTHAELYATRE